MNKKIGLFLIPAVIVLLVISMSWSMFWLKSFLEIDGCLDSGGRWNYEAGICEYQ